MDEGQRKAVDRVRIAAGGQQHPYCLHELNVHRWIVAWQNEDDAAENLRRHLSLRRLMPMPPHEDEESLQMNSFAPTTILGQNRPDDNKVVLLEHTGMIDVNGIVANARLNPFMRNKFRMMEELQKRVEAEERRSGRQSGGLLIMDLAGLSFSTSLLSVIAGPYRIVWGTLFEQYPQLIQQIIIVNAPTFVNILYQTCQPFIPSDYKEKIIISSGTEILKKYVTDECLPTEYGGSYPPLKLPISPIPSAEPIYCSLNTVSIPAGGYTVEKFQWSAGTSLEFLLQNEESFTYWIFHSHNDSNSDWTEIFPGCERAPLKQVDRWQWTVPLDGFYFIRYGNEKAWLFSTTVHSAILDGKTRMRLQPKQTFNL